MKIVIDISEETYNEVCWQGLQLCPRGNEELVNAIKNGTPLVRENREPAKWTIKKIKHKTSYKLPNGHWYWEDNQYVCSNCGGTPLCDDFDENEVLSKYCPYCGARMESEVKNETDN